MASFITIIKEGFPIGDWYSTLSKEENYAKIVDNAKSSGRFISSAVREKCSWVKVRYGQGSAIYRIRNAARA